jgi:sugar phosphate isomerase/epimerase
MENVGGFRDFQRSALEILLESPVFGLTLDIGHNYCTGGVDEPWIMEHADRLQHMHMHDAKDGKKDHQALGAGEIDIPKFLDLAEKHECTIVLETKTVAGLRESVAWIRKNGK